MRRAAILLVCVAHLGGKLHLATGGFVETSLHLIERRLAVIVAPSDVELGCRRLALGVLGIALAGRSQHTTLVEILRINDLGGQTVVEIILAHRHAGLGMACGGVARLNHEVGNDAMPQDAIVIA